MKTNEITVRWVEERGDVCYEIKAVSPDGRKWDFFEGIQYSIRCNPIPSTPTLVVKVVEILQGAIKMA